MASGLLSREIDNLVDLGWLSAVLAVTASLLPDETPSALQVGIVFAVAAVLSPRRPAEAAGVWSRWLSRLPWQGGVSLTGTLVFCAWQRLSPLWIVPFAIWPLFSLACRLDWPARLTELQAAPRYRPAIERARGLALRGAGPLGEALLLALGLHWGTAFWTLWPAWFAPAAAVAWIGLRAPVHRFLERRPAVGVLLLPGLGLMLVILAGLGLSPGGIQRGHWAIGLGVAVGLALLHRPIRSGDQAGAPDPIEIMRIALVACVAAWVMRGFCTRTVHGAADASWYGTMLHDMVLQTRAGLFPVFLGQTEYQFNGAIYPLRVAPAFHYLGALLDAATWRSLPTFALQNLLITLIGTGTALISYFCLASLARGRRWLAVVLALLLISCPGVVGIAYNSDLFMSWTTLPWVVIAFWAAARSHTKPDVPTFLALGGATGLTWWGHSPIALWTTLLLASLQVVRLLTCTKEKRAWGAMIVAAACFLMIAAYPMGSVLIYPPEQGVNAAGFQRADASTISLFVTESFPASVLPLSAKGRLLGDFQLGYALIALWLGALVWGWRTSPTPARGLLLWSGVFLVLLLPWPFLNTAAWKLVPAFVRDTTGNWAMNRLYLPAALGVVTATALIASLPDFWSSRSALFRRRLVILLLCATGWSLIEVRKFAAGSALGYRTEAQTEALLAPENALLTRFAYLVYPRLPAHFSHGVMDPQLLHRLLAPDLQSILADNHAAARAAAQPVADIRLLGRSTGEAAYEPSGPVTLKPDQAYLAEFTFKLPPDDPVVLHVVGPRMNRTYALPEYGEKRSFGQGGEHVGSFSLFTSSPRPEAVSFRLLTADGVSPPEGALGALIRILQYDSHRLPVQVESWAPYRSRVDAPSPGWFETPRMFQTGYAALVNGVPAEVRKTADGLVAVAVPAGSSQVRLTWRPPAGLLLIFWLSLSGTVCWLAWISRQAILSVRPAPPIP